MSNVRFSGYCERELFISSDEKFPSLHAVPGNEGHRTEKSAADFKTEKKRKSWGPQLLVKGKKETNVSRSMFTLLSRTALFLYLIYCR